ncbi:hypothetical protein BFAG_03358 [Bacteroides fragilis 3_1_12]|uniref:Transmembrane protein n=1 Tax=Bacteroides fragilis 3_1_12 TaxID=457424 RepID=A0ABN0BP05_BACFG|nr:hypothetical protein BFAG_03358 [Bacteroides fragilis 3_1_12]
MQIYKFQLRLVHDRLPILSIRCSKTSINALFIPLLDVFRRIIVVFELYGVLKLFIFVPLINP